MLHDSSAKRSICTIDSIVGLLLLSSSKHERANLISVLACMLLNLPFSLQSTNSAIEEGSSLSNIWESTPRSFLSTLCTSSSAPTARSRTRFPMTSSRSTTP
uniref:Uncharacterized protein n=1 Tax=Arundo donax TaxID=35708 RepID=A0A0A9HJC6_ARUDO